MGLAHVTVAVRPFAGAPGSFEADFLVDTGATDSVAPGAARRAAGAQPVGRTIYELPNGSVIEYEFGGAQIELMGEATAGRVIFGPDPAEPLPGVTALESVGILVGPASKTRKRLPAIPLDWSTDQPG